RRALDRVSLGMLRDRPVYRFVAGGKGTAIFGDTGETLESLSPDQAVGIAREFASEQASAPWYVEHLTEPDQWTLQNRASLPVHRVALGDRVGPDDHLALHRRLRHVPLRLGVGCLAVLADCALSTEARPVALALRRHDEMASLRGSPLRVDDIHLDFQRPVVDGPVGLESRQL